MSLRLQLADAATATYNALTKMGVVCFLALGLVLASVMPPMQGPDEPSHWKSALVYLNRLATGQETFCAPVVGLGEFLQRPQVEFMPYFPKLGSYQKLDQVKPVCSGLTVTYGNIFTYPGVTAAWALVPTFRSEAGDNLLRGFLLSRFVPGCLIAFLLWRLVSVASTARRRLIPGTLSLVAFCLSPLLIQQSFAVSADTVVNGSVLALVTAFLAGAEVAWLDLGLLLVLGLVAADTKPVIAPLFLALGLAPLALAPEAWSRRWQDRRWWLATVGVVLTLACCVFLVVILKTKPVSGTYQPGINVGEQVKHVAMSPFHTLKLMIDDIDRITHFGQWTGPLAWLDAPMPRAVARRWTSLLAITGVVDLALLLWTVRRRRAELRAALAPRPGLRVGVVLVAVVVLIFASLIAPSLTMYLTWTPVGAETVLGTQTRYLFPSSFAAIALFGMASGIAPAQHAVARRTWREALPGVLTYVGAAVFLVFVFQILIYTVLGLYLRFH